MPNPPIKPPNKRVAALKAELNNIVFNNDEDKIDFLVDELAYAKALVEELEKEIDED